jgi:hypothetical protein
MQHDSKKQNLARRKLPYGNFLTEALKHGNV